MCNTLILILNAFGFCNFHVFFAKCNLDDTYFICTDQSCSSCLPTPLGTSVANSPICNGYLVFMALVENVIGNTCAVADPCNRILGVESADETYEFIVVGGGTAGSVVAGRLSESGEHKVLLLEAGGVEPIANRVPSFYRTIQKNAEVDWNYETEPQTCCQQSNGKCWWSRGKVLGGCSELNGMMFSRGHVADFAGWGMFGASNWTWDDVYPYFLKFENNEEIGTVVDAAYHATGGPMSINRFRYQPPMLYDIKAAVEELGYPVIEDMNDLTTPEGFAIAQSFTKNGQRYTPARAYLKTETERPNLHVLLNAQATKVLLKDKKAYGVEYIKNGKTIKAYASKEVIITAGSLNTPQLLMLSGIGPKETLDKFEIPIVADLPVGENQNNHLGVIINYIMEKEYNYQILDRVALQQYINEVAGPMTSTGITQFTGFLYSNEEQRQKQQPDLQFFFNGLWAECSSTGQLREPVDQYANQGRNFSVTAVNLLPKSVGTVTIRSKNPLDAPVFDPKFFSHPEDMVKVKAAARVVQKIFETSLFKEKYGVKLDPNYVNVCPQESWSEEWLECMILYYTDPQNHQQGTASLGLVVDSELKVLNVQGLRVADASVIPVPPSGNPQASIMMVGERAADFILKAHQIQATETSTTTTKKNNRLRRS